MKNLLTIIFCIISIAVSAQTNDCGCFDGIGSSKSDKPSLIIEFGNGITVSVCGFEKEKRSENEVLISEFNVFNCKTGKQLVEYDALQNCIVRKDAEGLSIAELKYLPVGENWEWGYVKIGVQQILVKEDKLVVLDQKPEFEKVKIDKKRLDSFLEKIRGLKGVGKLDDPEKIIARLEILALNDNKEAKEVLYDFKSYFNCKIDGAIAEQWKDAVATVERMRK